MAVRSALINVMVRAAQKAGRALIRDFGEVEQLQVSKKGPRDFVSNADTKSEQILFEELSKARADFGFLMEERGEIKGLGERFRWIVDPLDGTTNFLHGLPHWSVSIACEEAGRITAAVVYDPVKDELFWAERGAGAWKNNNRLRVSARRRIEEALVGTGLPPGDAAALEDYVPRLRNVMEKAAAVRRFGSAALDLCYVAAGRYDGFFEIGLAPWDTAAGVLLVREAGGMASEIDGGENPVYGRTILATNGMLHRDIHQLIRPPAKIRLGSAPKD
jgi:myo-inositol-1(or 4)-monophosphatase